MADGEVATGQDAIISSIVLGCVVAGLVVGICLVLISLLEMVIGAAPRNLLFWLTVGGGVFLLLLISFLASLAKFKTLFSLLALLPTVIFWNTIVDSNGLLPPPNLLFTGKSLRTEVAAHELEKTSGSRYLVVVRIKNLSGELFPLQAIPGHSHTGSATNARDKVSAYPVGKKIIVYAMDTTTGPFYAVNSTPKSLAQVIVGWGYVLFASILLIYGVMQRLLAGRFGAWLGLVN